MQAKNYFTFFVPSDLDLLPFELKIISPFTSNRHIKYKPCRAFHLWQQMVGSVALLVARRTNDRKVVGSRPTKVACITVLTGNRMGWTARCGRPPLLPSCRKLEFRLSALMDSDLAWVNGQSGRQSWRYADAFQRSIISEAIYHLFTILLTYFTRTLFCCTLTSLWRKWTRPMC